MANIPHLHPIHSTNSKNSTRPECRPKKDIMQNTVVEMNKAALPKALIWPEEGGQSQPAPSDLQVCPMRFHVPESAIFQSSFQTFSFDKRKQRVTNCRAQRTFWPRVVDVNRKVF